MGGLSKDSRRTGTFVGVVDVVVLVCWPTSGTEFSELWSSGHSDLLVQMSGGKQAAGAVCEFLMDEFGHSGTRLLAELEAIGVRVVRRASLSDLRMAAQTYKYIVLVAHHPTTLYATDDVIDAMCLRDRVAAIPEQTAVVVPVDDSSTVTELIEALNGLIRASLPRYALGGRDLQAPTENTTLDNFAFSRIWLDAFLGGCVRHGPAIELWSGLHTIDQFVNAFPLGFSGALDLIVCNSVFHVDRLKRKNPAMVCNANFAEIAPLARLAWATVICKSLSKRPLRDVDLIEASQRAGKGLR